MFLDVTLAHAAPRVGFNQARPLLLGNPRAQWQALMEARRPVYERLATVRVLTDGHRPADVAELIEQELAVLRRGEGNAVMTDTRTVRVDGDQPYDVVIGRNLLAALPDLRRPGRPAGARRAPVRPGDDRRRRPRGPAWRTATRRSSPRCPDAEEAKTAQVAAFLLAGARPGGLHAHRRVVAVGGGATTDLGGFVAATWLRGIRVVQVPTTLLAMVDAAVGGKTGHQHGRGQEPRRRLPPARRACSATWRRSSRCRSTTSSRGSPRWSSAGFIADPRILELVEENTAVLTDPVAAASSPVLLELVERAVAVKARVVGEDLREGGLREILNYGHTFAHAIEHVERFQWRHGAAVSVGMVYVAELARLAGRLSDEVVDRHRSILTSLGPARHVPRRPLGPAPGGDATGQEDARRPAAVRRARGHRQARPARGPRPDAARRRVRRGQRGRTGPVARDLALTRAHAVT